MDDDTLDAAGLAYQLAGDVLDEHHAHLLIGVKPDGSIRISDGGPKYDDVPLEVRIRVAKGNRPYSPPVMAMRGPARNRITHRYATWRPAARTGHPERISS